MTAESISLRSLEWSDDVLSGRITDRSMDDELADVVLLLDDARRAVAGIDFDDADVEQRTVAAMMSAFAEATPAPPTTSEALESPSTPAGRRFQARRVGRRIAVLGAAGALSISAAAAATGSLPRPIQSAVARSVAQVGVDLPDGREVIERDPVTTDGAGEPVESDRVPQQPVTSVPPNATEGPESTDVAVTAEPRDQHGAPTDPAEPNAKPDNGGTLPPQANGRPPEHANAGGTGNGNAYGVDGGSGATGNANGSANGAENGNANGAESGKAAANGNTIGNGPVTSPPGQGANHRGQ